ncbi:MAG: peptidylprolyl isomerase [Sulfuricella sp.]|jgi:cyclophilin family peptidyl-prolyl cis-trans isomerase|nr:peptidylprolyl isomerase [Sulfuricella sp.]
MKSLRLFTLFFALCLSIGAHAANPMVEMKTNLGSFTLELYPSKAPKTVENFLKYVKTGFYKDTVFHRVIENFMIQGGGYGTNLLEKDTFPPIQNEADNGLKNEIYTIAMARTSYPHSAAAQFFINVRDNPFLNHTANTPNGWGYAVFGKVVKGQDVVMKISKVKTGAREPLSSDVPLENVVIEDVKLLK